MVDKSRSRRQHGAGLGLDFVPGTVIGVKLGAMVQLNVTTNGDGQFALLDQSIAIRRETLLMGQVFLVQ
jgi:F0F1-type ATP synthase assembly protein I